MMYAPQNERFKTGFSLAKKCNGIACPSERQRCSAGFSVCHRMAQVSLIKGFAHIIWRKLEQVVQREWLETMRLVLL
jgi:hypothetical protein